MMLSEESPLKDAIDVLWATGMIYSAFFVL